MRSILIFSIALIPMTFLSGQRKIEAGVVSMSNLVKYYDFREDRSFHPNVGFSLGIQSSYFLNDRFSITATLLYTRLNYNGLMLTDCITIPGILHSDNHDHVELFTAVRYHLLKNKWVNPYISAGFIQGSRSGRYIYIDFGENFETTNRQVHFSYNYGAIAGIGMSIQVGKKISINLEGSVRNYVRRPSSYSPQTFFSPSFSLNYRIQ